MNEYMKHKKKQNAVMPELPEEVGSFMEREIGNNLLLWAAGQTMFCPVCTDIMDCERTTIAELRLDGRVLRTAVVCSTCWRDNLSGQWRLGVEKAIVAMAAAGDARRPDITVQSWNKPEAVFFSAGGKAAAAALETAAS